MPILLFISRLSEKYYLKRSKRKPAQQAAYRHRLSEMYRQQGRSLKLTEYTAERLYEGRRIVQREIYIKQQVVALLKAQEAAGKFTRTQQSKLEAYQRELVDLDSAYQYRESIMVRVSRDKLKSSGLDGVDDLEDREILALFEEATREFAVKYNQHFHLDPKPPRQKAHRLGWFQSQFCQAECTARDGCCSRDCGCCKQSRNKARFFIYSHGHCTGDCGYCIAFRAFELVDKEKKRLFNLDGFVFAFERALLMMNELAHFLGAQRFAALLTPPQ